MFTHRSSVASQGALLGTSKAQLPPAEPALHLQQSLRHSVGTEVTQNIACGPSVVRTGPNGGKKKRKKKTKKKTRNKKTKSRTNEHVSLPLKNTFRSRDTDTSVFTFRFFQVPKDLKKTKWVPNKRNIGYPGSKGNIGGPRSVDMKFRQSFYLRLAGARWPR